MATATKEPETKDVSTAVETVSNKGKQVDELVLKFKTCRRAAAPIVAISTADAAATIRQICAGIVDDVPKMQWNVVNGMTGINEVGREQIESKEELQNCPDEVALVQACPHADERTIVFVHMSDRFMDGNSLESKMFIQGIWNLRDDFKRNKRTIVLLGQQVKLPPELQNDTVPLEDALPDTERLENIVLKQYDNAGLKVEKTKVPRAVEAVLGLSAFQAEQVTAMSLSEEGLDTDGLWERKRKQVEQTPGLSINREGFKFDDIGGLDAAKKFLTRYFNGKKRPSVIVFIDEIEKAMAGEGDMSGISQDQLGETLKYMQNEKSPGLMFVGQPGSGKSVLAKACGNEFGVPTIELDYGGMKGGIVGESETNLRNAFRVIKSVSGGNALFIATSNGIESLKSELKRRYKLGTYFFDFPSAQEQGPIWNVHMSKRGLEQQELPGCENWTGAEIENCCDLADCMGISLTEAAEYVIPVAISDAQASRKRQHQANSKYQDATTGKIYSMPKPKVEEKDAEERQVNLTDDE